MSAVHLDSHPRSTGKAHVRVRDDWCVLERKRSKQQDLARLDPGVDPYGSSRTF